MSGHNQRKAPFNHSKHAQAPRVALRAPLLSMGRQRRVMANMYERTDRVGYELRSRFKEHDLARIEDAPIFFYLFGLCAHETTFGQAFHIAEFDVAQMLTALGREDSDFDAALDSLRRLTGTAVTLHGWKGKNRELKQYPDNFPLIEVDRLTTTKFQVTLSDWLSDQIHECEILKVPSPDAYACGFRFRLEAWALSWVGRNPATGEWYIKRRDAEDRMGPMPPGMLGPAWDHLVAAAMADDIPSHCFTLTERVGQPALKVERRFAPLLEDLGGEVVLDLDS